ncbi:MAG: hypothetical protein PHY73_03735 [Candidatus Omnitrophica bacterium]|nr:hypothetical protein [Candidatus Omnitrophota bacterium]
MDVNILPTTLVWFFLIGGLVLVAVVAWATQVAAISSKNREKYKSQKIVENYYEGKSESVKASAVSAQILKRWKQNLSDVDDD